MTSERVQGGYIRWHLPDCEDGLLLTLTSIRTSSGCRISNIAVMADTGTNPPPVPPKDTEASSHDPAVDYVLVFQAIPKKNVRSNTKVPATERSKIADEYSRLTKALETAGLQHTSRQGKAGTGTVLIFVRAHSSTLARAVKAERCVNLCAVTS